MPGPWEKYAQPGGASGPWDKYRDAVSSQPEPAPGLGQRFVAGLTQTPIEQPQGFDVGDIAEFAGSQGLPIAGGIIGSVAGPLGAGVGAAAGRALQYAVSQGISQVRPDMAQERTPGEVIGDVAKTGAINAVIPAGLGLVGKAASSIKGSVIKAGAQAIRTATGVPQSFGENALRGNLNLFGQGSRAAGEGFEELFKGSGVSGLAKSTKQALSFAGREGKEAVKTRLSSADYEAIADTAAQRLQDGTISVQEAIWGSQSLAKLKELAKFGNPEQSINRAINIQQKEALDSFIEKNIEGYAQARQGFFNAKTNEAFRSVFPLNKNQTSNALRGFGAGAASIATGSPIPVLATSPAAVGLGIQVAGTVGRAGAATLRAATPGSGPALEEMVRYFRGQR